MLNLSVTIDGNTTKLSIPDSKLSKDIFAGIVNEIESFLDSLINGRENGTVIDWIEYAAKDIVVLYHYDIDGWNAMYIENGVEKPVFDDRHWFVCKVEGIVDLARESYI